MGARFEIVVAAMASSCAAEPADACEACADLIEDWHDRLSVFDPASEVSRLNARAGFAAAPVARDLFDLLTRCEQYREQTGGAFDIGVGALMAARGFRGEEPGGARAALTLDPDGKSARIDPADASIDLGGVAKGFVIDLCLAEMRELGVDSALIHGGTSTAGALGAPPGQDAWRVRVAGTSEVIALRDNAMSVSAPSGRTIDGAGHVLDPQRDGAPACGVRTAWCTGTSAEATDAYATAMVVTGNAAAPDGYAGGLVRDNEQETDAYGTARSA